MAGVTGAPDTVAVLASMAGFKNADDTVAGFSGVVAPAEESGNNRLAVEGSFESDIFLGVRAKIVGFGFCGGTFFSGESLSGRIFSKTFLSEVVEGKIRGSLFCSDAFTVGVTSAGRVG